MTPDYNINVNITVGFTQDTEVLLMRLLRVLEGKLSPEDQAALAALLEAEKVLKAKADLVSGKPAA